MNNYNDFLKWTKENNIEMHQYQHDFIKALFNEKKIIMPRQHGRNYGLELVANYYEFKKDVEKV